jgi:lycopene cyclase-like protein
VPAGGSDVLVVGGGPAGLAAAAACAATGLHVGLLTDDPAARWTQTYGAWLDELVAAGFDGVTAHRWTDTRVRTGGGGDRSLGRTYCLIDNDRLRSALLARAAGATVTAGRAVALELHDDRVVVTTTGGARHSARAVIDASGQPPVFARRRHGALAYQTAFGMVATFDRPPIPAGTACLMDLDARPFGAAEPATFLYAMDLGDGRWFVEETCLARRPALPLHVLEQRLRRRLAARGAQPQQVLTVERCAFAMDPPLPARGPAIAFGAAAAMVHPATGYHVATALRRAPELAWAVREALATRETSSAVAAAVSDAVWPGVLRRQHALYRAGLEVLLRLDVPATQRFFDAFFALPAARWSDYVSRTASPAQIQATMLRLMWALPWDVRRAVLRAVAQRPARRWLARAMLPPLMGR